MAPKISIPVVDVRDAADAHVNAIEKGKNGSRYILSHYNGESFLNLANHIKSDDKLKSYKLPRREAPKFLIWIMSWFDSRLSGTLATYGKSFDYDNKKSKEELDVEYREVSKSMVEMANNLIDIGYIEDLRS